MKARDKLLGDIGFSVHEVGTLTTVFPREDLAPLKD